MDAMQKNIQFVFKGCVVGFVGLAIGILAWTPPTHFSVLWLLPVLWGLMSRPEKIILIISYAMGSLWSVPITVNDYFNLHHFHLGIEVWLMAVVGVSIAWILMAILIPQRFSGIQWLLALVVEALPPLGAIGMASPLLGATAVFMGTGIAGLLVTLVLQSMLASRDTSIKKAGAMVLLCASVFVAGNQYIHPADLSLPGHWYGINTHLGREPQTPEQWVKRQLSLKKTLTLEMHSSPHHSFFLLPEGISGTWSPFFSMMTWADEIRLAQKYHDTFILGSTIPVKHKKLLDGFFIMGQDKGLIYAHQPIPVTEWTPYSSPYFKAFWTKFGSLKIGSTPVALSVCYEQLLVWPLLWQIIDGTRPVVILAPSNHGWDMNNPLESEIQTDTARAWSRLYFIPIVFARNTPEKK